MLSLCSMIANIAEPKAEDAKYMDECLAWKHIAVVRPRSLTLPKVNMAKKTSDAGSLDGDRVLFEIANGDIVGRYEMSITNSDKISELENSDQSEWDARA